MAAIFASIEFIRRNPEAAPVVANIADVTGYRCPPLPVQGVLSRAVV
jgi:hypothetical protein